MPGVRSPETGRGDESLKVPDLHGEMFQFYLMHAVKKFPELGRKR